jgi:hypothetical protein
VAPLVSTTFLATSFIVRDGVARRQGCTGGHRAAALRRRCPDELPEDGADAAQHSPDRTRTGRLRAATGAAAHPPRLPGSEGRLHLDRQLRTRVDALNAAGIDRRGPYHLRHTFAAEGLAAGVSIFELASVMGASVKEIDRTYGHLARDANDSIRTRLEARAKQPGVGERLAKCDTRVVCHAVQENVRRERRDSNPRPPA